MRLFWIFFAIEAMILAANCDTKDDETDKFVLDALCNVDWNVNHDKGYSVPPPPCKRDENIKQDPTDIDPTISCTTLDNPQGICVPYHKCNPTTKIKDFDDTTLKLKPCSHYLDVCCRKNHFQNVTANNETNDDTAVASNRYNKANIPAGIPSPVLDESGVNNLGERRKECGWSNAKLNVPSAQLAMVAQKSPFANFGDFPFMVALLRKFGHTDWSQHDYLGGGTLIHPSVVLTVAHKLSNRKTKLEASDIKCRAGEWDTQTTSEPYQFQDRDVAKYTLHEYYYRKSAYNDTALLFLESPFELRTSPHIGIGCLATALPSPGSECYSMGWGNEEFKRNKAYAVILKKVKLQYVESQRCQSMLRETRLGSFFELHESLMCANGEPGIDTCRGDGGSPLVCPIQTEAGDTRYVVYGMPVYGIDCGKPKIPGVYVNVALFKNWVDGKMQQEGYSTESYTV